MILSYMELPDNLSLAQLYNVQLKKMQNSPSLFGLDFNIFPFHQTPVFCGPEKSACVKNQTLRDKNCLVSCFGLYADVADGSLKETVMEGFYFIIHKYYSFLKSSFFQFRISDTE